MNSNPFLVEALIQLASARRQYGDAQMYRQVVMASKCATTTEMATAFRQLMEAETELLGAVDRVVLANSTTAVEAAESRAG